jgi:diguanylate cyclase (GGDEF)-like protein
VLTAKFEMDADLKLQLDALYKAAPASVMSIVGGLVALSIYWEQGIPAGLIAWFVVVAGVAVVHLISAGLRHYGLPRGFTTRHWARLVCGIYGTSGVAWGVGAALMILEGNAAQALVVCCLITGAVTVTFPAAVYQRAYNLFQFPALLLTCAGLFASGVPYSNALAIAGVLLCGTLAAMARGLGTQLTLALKLSRENSRLVADLQERKAALEAANRDLEIQTETDPMTGLGNRRRLMRVLRASSGALGVLLIDVDHFKSYNDTFGHAEGDTCLRRIADALSRSTIAGVTLVARYGGEEFAIVVDARDHHHVRAVAEAMRKTVEALHDEGGSALRRAVTISVGVALREAGEDKTITQLITEADERLYEAKRAGRNRVHDGREPRAKRTAVA